MTRTSKSPKAVALVAYATAKRTLPPFSHLKSPKKFTQPQLVACLVLKEFFRTDYRGIIEILLDSSDLQKVLELEEVPHYTTLQKAAKRFTNKRTITRLLRETLAVATTSKVMKNTVALSAIDSTGLESHYTSSYFVRRRTRDTKEYENTYYNIQSIIPNRIGRPTTKLPSGKYRRIMALRFSKKLYGQRWMVETLNSMFKKRLGPFLRARTYWSQMREMMLRLFSFNVLILRY